MRLTIVGASGHGKVVADIAGLQGYDEIEFLDDNPSLTECAGFPVIGGTNLCADRQNDIFIAIGNPQIRQRFMEKYSDKNMPVLIHPSAVIARGVELRRGTVVMACAVLNPGVEMGEGVIINTCASVDHDCKIHDYVHVAVGAHLCGTVDVGMRTWIGAGSIVSNNIDICSDCMIGAGAVVVKSIPEAGTYIGVPAALFHRG